MSTNEEEETQVKKRRERRAGRSMFWPIFLIAIGVFLLLANLGLLPALNWAAALRYWPLLLVFAGLNIIVRQVPRPFGTWLSLLVALLTVGVFSYLLFYADSLPGFESTTNLTPASVQRSQLSMPAEGVRSAEIEIDFDVAGGVVRELEDSNNLIEADVSYTGDLEFVTEVTDGQATVLLEAANRDNWMNRLNPANWLVEDLDRRWQIGLNPTVRTDLVLDLGSGPALLELQDLTLGDLLVDGGSGRSELSLPGGDYDLEYDVASGAVQMILPESGRHRFAIDGGSGRLIIQIPAKLEVRLVTESGSGSLNILDERLEIVASESDRAGVWETSGYEDSRNRVELFVAIGSGSVTIEQP